MPPEIKRSLHIDLKGTSSEVNVDCLVFNPDRLRRFYLDLIQGLPMPTEMEIQDLTLASILGGYLFLHPAHVTHPSLQSLVLTICLVHEDSLSVALASSDHSDLILSLTTLCREPSHVQDAFGLITSYLESGDVPRVSWPGIYVDDIGSQGFVVATSDSMDARGDFLSQVSLVRQGYFFGFIQTPLRYLVFSRSLYTNWLGHSKVLLDSTQSDLWVWQGDALVAPRSSSLLEREDLLKVLVRV